jgi:hypothetical protein
MATRRRVRIIRLVGVSHHTVGEHGIPGCGGERGSGDRRPTGGAVRALVALRRLASWQFRPGDHRR